ncbi:hypothetical protein [Alloscardovia omnicolens]|uniref:hypothetical protein n=1 Tax=Alloscardovia omnicolens TaxID=419015 RepID=UPI003A61BC92
MRDFNSNNIIGNVRINDLSEYGRPLSVLSNEELAAEESFRMIQLKKESKRRRKQLLAILLVAAVLLIVSYFIYKVCGDWQPINILIATCSVAVAYVGVIAKGSPNRFEKNHTEAIRSIRDLYRLRGYHPS